MAFHPTRLYNAVLPLLLVAFALPASFLTLATPRRYSSYSMADAAKLSSTKNNNNKENCLPHGCPLFPLDVIVNESTRNSLEELRKQGKTQPAVDGSAEYAHAMESLQTAGDDDKVVLTLMGYKGGRLVDQINQDSATILSPFIIIGDDDDENDSSLPPTTAAVQLLGVFDGHGDKGEITSKYASKEIPRVLALKLKWLVEENHVASPTALPESLVIQAIQKSFVEVDQNDPTGGVGGATATMILQLGHKLYIANAGDSRSFIGVHVTGGNVQVVYTSREDKPDLPDERQRIMEMGGYVHIPSDPTQDVPRAYYVDPQGRARFGLAMSRTIGDWVVQGVIAEPIVDVLNIASLVQDAMRNHTTACQQQQQYSYASYNMRRNAEEEDGSNCPLLHPSEVQIVAVSASDGMMDYLKPKEIAREFANAFFGGSSELEYGEREPAAPPTAHPFVVAEHLILKAAEGWDVDHQSRYRDDICVAAVKVIVDDQILWEGQRDLKRQASEAANEPEL